MPWYWKCSLLSLQLYDQYFLASSMDGSVSAHFSINSFHWDSHNSSCSCILYVKQMVVVCCSFNIHLSYWHLGVFQYEILYHGRYGCIEVDLCLLPQIKHYPHRILSQYAHFYAILICILNILVGAAPVAVFS